MLGIIVAVAAVLLVVALAWIALTRGAARPARPGPDPELPRPPAPGPEVSPPAPARSTPILQDWTLDLPPEQPEPARDAFATRAQGAPPPASASPGSDAFATRAQGAPTPAPATPGPDAFATRAQKAPAAASPEPAADPYPTRARREPSPPDPYQTRAGAGAPAPPAASPVEPRVPGSPGDPYATRARAARPDPAATPEPDPYATRARAQAPTGAAPEAPSTELFQAPAPPAPARLIAREGPHQGEEFLLDEVVTIGRTPENGLALDRDTAASRRHAEIRAAEGRYRIRDLGSSNGTHVNGRQVSECELAGGDEIRIGRTVFVFEP